MEIGKWKMAQTWRHFKRPASSKGLWKQFVDASKERDQMSQGGTPQLVQPGPGRPGYAGYEESGAADDFKGQRSYTDKKTGKRYRTEEFKTHLRSKTKGTKFKYPDFKGTTHIGGKKTKEYAEYVYQQEKASGIYKDRWKNLPDDVKKERIQKSLDWQKTDEGKKVRAERHKKRILKKTPLSKVDQSALKRFDLNLKYLKHINEVIQEFGGVRPNPETINDLIEIRFETDPEFQKIWNEVNGNKPFSTKNLSPSSLRNTYDRAMSGTKRVTVDNFKIAIRELFEKELVGTGTSLDDFIKNDFKLKETFLADQVDSPKAQYQRRYKEILKGETGWTPGKRGSWAWFANPEQKGTTVTTNLNKRLKLDQLSKEGKGALEFVRSHYFGNIQGKKLYDLGLLDEDAAKNWKERYTWKPRYINDLQSMTYDRDVYKALRNYTNHGDKSKLASEINEAATKAKRLGLDVDELKLNTETGKFNFIDKKRTIQTGGDRETRYLVQNAMNEIASVQSSTTKELSDDVIKSINQDYGKRGEKIINQVKKGSTHFYPDTPKWSQRIKKFKPKISGAGELYSFPANLPKMWKMMGSGTRKMLGWMTAGYTEKLFYDWDKKNEMSKGKTEEEAAGIALNNASFGIIPNKKYLPELKKIAEDMGINPQAFEKVYFLNEQMVDVQKQDAQYQQRIEMIKKMPGDPERKARALADMEKAYANWQKGMTSQIGKWSEDVAGQIAISKTKLPKPSLDQIAEERYNITDEDWMKPFAEIQMVGEEKLRREKDRAYDVQSKLADPESGSGYKWITNWFTPSENFFDLRTTGQEKQRLIDDMVRFDPKELYRYNKARGLDPDSPVTKEALENLKYEHPGLGLGQAKGGRVSYLDGGIVSLLKK